jgi:serine/threonine protein kinase
MAELQHPAVVRVIEQNGSDGGYQYFVMVFVPGGNFHQAILGKVIPADKVLSIIERIGDALALAHSKGIIHRDIKPSNILLDAMANPLLADFDLVGAADTTGGTRTGAMGTALYAAPECLDRPQDADARADVYGLGMTAVFGLNGADLPFSFMRKPDAIFERLPCAQPVVDVLRRATSWELNERHQNAGEFLQALKNAHLGGRRTTETTKEADDHKHSRIQTEDLLASHVFFEKDMPTRLQQMPMLAKDINSVIHFSFIGEGGGVWTLDLTKESDWVAKGAWGIPAMTITVSHEDFMKIRQKKLNPQMAAMQGKLKFEPMDMGLAMKLAKLISW